MNYIEEYWAKIQSGEEVVSQKIYKTYSHVMKLLEHGEGEYFFSDARANHVIDFIEKFCHHSKGKCGGQLVKLELWEKAMLSTIFGFVDIEGRRLYREAVLIIGKKNGKSLLASAVGDYLLMADGEPGAEIYAVATKKDQAKIIWTEAKRMILKSPSLRKRARCLIGEIDCDANDGVFKPLASDSDTLDGLNIHGALMDEIHQWKNGRVLYDIIADGVTAREQPLVFITSTAGVVREDLYDEKYEEARKVIDGYDDEDGYKDIHFIAFVYELDSRAEWQDEKCWKKANPGLGTIKNYSTLKDKVEKAKANPQLVKNLVCKEFNIPETSSEAWMSYEELDNRSTFQLDKARRKLIYTHDGTIEELPYPKYGIAGVDLSSTTDLTGAVVMFQVPHRDEIFVQSMGWLPSDLLNKRITEDKIPYDKWIGRGVMRLSSGNKINYHDVVEWFREIQEQEDIYLSYIGYDAWSAKYFVDEMEGFFGKYAMFPVRQGVQTLSNPMKQIRNEFCDKKIVYNNSPVFKWCLSNTSYVEDKNGNIQPHKTSKVTRRIDLFAAMLDAYTVYLDNQAEYQSLI